MWLEDYHRQRFTHRCAFYLFAMWMARTCREADLPDGWTLMRWINEEVNKRYPWKIMIAEDPCKTMNI